MIVQNAAYCIECSDEIISKHVHDFVTCKCGLISVDGGQEYIRRAGDLTAAVNMSWSLPDELYWACVDAVKDAIQDNKNAHGIANAVMRKLRDADRVVADGEPRIVSQNNNLQEVIVEEVDGTWNRYKRIAE
jgi:hypothetical protein